MRRPPSHPLRLSIVLPCYDEVANIERVVRDALRVGRELASELEVVVVDDGSRDGTAAAVEALAETRPELRLVRHRENRGYGAALRSGFLAARMPWVFYTDGDGQFDLGELRDILPLLESHDVVSCYRIDRRDGAFRSALGRAFTTSTHLALGLDLVDVNCAFKIYPRWLFDVIEMTCDGALIDAEVLSAARDLGLRVAQPGVHHRPRLAGRQTGASPRVVARAGAELLSLALRRRLARRGAPATPPLAEPQ